ncbi:MAG: FAD-dependent oxidoreductase [Mariniblastus sp.]|nr:FAD-dependent oxidoreductase [Mariniblastus sp.]
MTHLDSLPQHLHERARLHESQCVSQEADGSMSPSMVLYWMRTAVRADENPALDVACHIACSQNLPLLVYYSISNIEGFASDRHHRFMLQGARDVQQQFATNQTSFAFQLVRGDEEVEHFMTLVSRSAAIVTEEMPVDPQRQSLESLIQSTSVPVISVDTACVAPMRLIKKPFTRAFQFRSAVKAIHEERLTRLWPTQKEKPARFDLSELPFDPMDLQAADFGELISSCEIDHGVGPVVDTEGGSAAGYARWKHFKKKSLQRYARQRNNPLLDGVSRLSAYLHYGMISPFRIARECAEIDHEGAEKYLDELLVWREMAYTFCFHQTDHDQWSALPNWARKTLLDHAKDRRPHIHTWEQLARGQTEDPLWNAAQKSLLMHGELHNNLRMTWGKGIINWKQDPREALATIIDLNHRYALDGRDPASYGGILWCLGQFDRPFQPEQQIIGTVRSRPLSTHSDRLNPAQYSSKVNQPRFDPVPKVGIVGAGLAGLFAARTLQDHGLKVTLFDKSRGVGGRMATRRVEGQGTFDHGAQYFTAKDPRFVRYVESWLEQGVVAKWPDQQLGQDQKIVVLEEGKQPTESSPRDRFVGAPAMNSICKHLATNLEIHLQTRVAKILSGETGLELLGDDARSLGTFDCLLVTAPAPQSVDLVADVPDLVNRISPVEMKPCWATMVSFASPITDQWVGAFVNNSILTWVARNGTKPGRQAALENVVLHAAPKWTAENWERDPTAVASQMLSEFWRVTGIAPCPPTHLKAHRWKYALPVNPSGGQCFMNPTKTIFVCGDWASGSRVEGAFLSGLSGVGRILETLSVKQDVRITSQGTLFE